jgi:F0F1-type ATP synthase assembly protein I
MPLKKNRPPISSIAKYSGLMFQLLGSCMVGLYAGKYLDETMHLNRPTWAVLLTVCFMIAALYAVYKQLLNDQ